MGKQKAAHITDLINYDLTTWHIGEWRWSLMNSSARRGKRVRW